MANPTTTIVGTDAREQSDGAIRAGALFADRGDTWQIVSAVPPFPLMSAELDLHITPEILDASRRVRLRLVQEQLERVLGSAAVKVEIVVRNGAPADVLCAVAGEVGATLIVTGLGRHRIVDRLLADETAVRIIRAASTPVLAVPDDFSRAPRTAIVGVDFSEASLHAARLAIQMIHGAATIYLANVAPRDDVLSLAARGRAAYEAQAITKLQQLADQLDAPKAVHLQPVVLQGDSGTALLSYAADTQSELIALGTRGLGLVSRLFLGSVATKVIRASPIAVLTVPS
jgi:nucleotide-binding universal stress UspA family protein